VTVATFDYAAGGGPALAVGFSEDVADYVAAGDLVLQNLTTGATVPAAATRVTWDARTRTARWTFPGYPAGLPDGNYHAEIAAGVVQDPAGNPLASSFATDFFVLAGDANHDRTVDFADLVVLAQNYNTTDKPFDQGDFNYDQNVDFNDLVILAQRYNTALPNMPAGAAANAEFLAPADTAATRDRPTPTFLPPRPKPAPRPIDKHARRGVAMKPGL
jgi:hypothetical protein